MVSIEDIPAEQRWEIAARALSAFKKNRKPKLISTMEIIPLKIRLHAQYGY
ncbi:MAG: hypothetical protein GQ469_08435 [Methanosarcinales archaeon]|nr:hypothetical protein [Methanosarcinales archaeon]